MLLVIDVGNTNITLGVFDKEELFGTFRMKTKQPRTSDEYGITLQELVERHGIESSKINAVIIASVVPDVMHSLGSAIIKYFGVKPVVVSAGIKTGIRIVTENPRQVGPDRIVDAVGAYTLYGGPTIVVDFGTATTFDVIGPDGTFEAGVIAPGIRTSANVLYRDAARLPEIEILKPKTILANSTIDSMQAGLYYGVVGETKYMVQKMKDGGYAYVSDNALVVDVKEDTDTKEVPPCMLLKSDGASLYTTTDLATIVERMKLYNPDEIIYVVDKRQELHFIQCFRCAKKAKLVEDDTRLTFLGFGTMNGKDGKPFKTRDGGVMRLENLIKEINEEMYRKIMENHETDPEEARKTAQIVGLSAIKYGDLSNQASKDYVFDVDRFTSFEGNTGPYILYTIVRIKSILARYQAEGGSLEGITIQTPNSESEKALMLALSKFNAVMENAFEELAPHKICAYIYELANDFNHFYHEVKILSEENEEKKKGYLALLMLTRDVLESCIHVLGFTSPERM